MVVIYSLLAVALRSYVQPLIIMGAIPFGIIGAVIGHMLLGYDLSLISLMGVIALSGVVVNDSLIMIDHANRYRGDEPAFEAICDAGVRRFRPILLTSLTTLFVVAVLFAFGGGAIRPFALVLIIGIIAGTYSTVFIASAVVHFLQERFNILDAAQKEPEESATSKKKRKRSKRKRGGDGEKPATA